MSSHIEKVVLLQGVRSSSFVCHQTVLDCERIRAGGLDEMMVFIIRMQCILNSPIPHILPVRDERLVQPDHCSLTQRTHPSDHLIQLLPAGLCPRILPIPLFLRFHLPASPSSNSSSDRGDRLCEGIGNDELAKSISCSNELVPSSDAEKEICGRRTGSDRLIPR